MQPELCEIIDSHIHPYLDNNSNFAMFNPLSPGDFVKFMKKCGISRACGSCLIKGLSETCSFREIHEMNVQSLRFRDQFPDFFIPGIHIHPDYPHESCTEVEHFYKNEGIKWVGELVGYLTNYKSYFSPGAFEIYGFLEKLNLPVNIHPFDMNEMAKISESFPRLKIIIAHPGDGKAFREKVDYMTKYPNMYLDISGSAPHRWGWLRYAINMAGKDKILLGSDFPICNPAVYVSIVRSEPLTDVEREAVFSENFKRLTGLK
ncbi:MAG: amidohydrolase family protein [Victivallaceae bacterium]|nr:amidohydrolase family protein [Victivallaceae bacterium]